MHGICIAEQIMHVAENLLICSHQEHAEIIRFAGFHAMHRQSGTRSVRGNEVGYFAVAVAGDVLDGAGAHGFLVEARDGYDGENLVDGP